MKTLLSPLFVRCTMVYSLLGLLLLWASCRREPPEPGLPCDCEQRPITQNLPNLKGRLLHPTKTNQTYRIRFIIDSNPELQPIRVVCMDSSFIRQVLDKQLSDSSMIQFTGGVVDGIVCLPGTLYDVTDAPPPLRVLTIDKL